MKLKPERKKIQFCHGLKGDKDLSVGQLNVGRVQVIKYMCSGKFSNYKQKLRRLSLGVRAGNSNLAKCRLCTRNVMT